MNELYLHISETASTNVLMKEMLRKSALPEGFVVHADFQRQGKGQGSNTWESAKGKNLLFSLLLRPHHIAIEEQFIISQVVSLGIKNALNELNSDEAASFSIKWPNDLYWHDKKIGGILIENTLHGRIINASVIGIGLNINQEVFYSDAPNPVSLKQIAEKAYPIDLVLNAVTSNILHCYLEMSPEQVRKQYMDCLYRKTGYHPYQTTGKSFSAKIIDIEKDGRLILENRNGEVRGYYFKEVEFISS
ncbi:MAG: biotin--[acetyl-CoA-carboxylase] ligase [Paludibacter sp.]|nr:biotin--[acetyl-CoA-carboxylase] ligase [Paludibacter sp.]MDD4197993.1 biotin--[acetyl-CoA-carboxylase] ligase [Paludibacter sp.]MDD4427626.1 biotin--[acetyl-CoA-carboxylase] ligase [Paludibacter sp.]